MSTVTIVGQHSLNTVVLNLFNIVTPEKHPGTSRTPGIIAFDKERRIPAVGASTEDVDVN